MENEVQTITGFRVWGLGYGVGFRGCITTVVCSKFKYGLLYMEENPYPPSPGPRNRDK